MQCEASAAAQCEARAAAQCEARAAAQCEARAAAQCEALVAWLNYAGVSRADTQALFVERVAALIEQRFDVSCADSVLLNADSVLPDESDESTPAVSSSGRSATAPPTWLDELIQDGRWSSLICTLAAQHKDSRLLQFASRRLAMKMGGNLFTEMDSEGQAADETLLGIPAMLGALLRERLAGHEHHALRQADYPVRMQREGLAEACATDGAHLEEAQALLTESNLRALPAELDGALAYLRHARALTACAAAEADEAMGAAARSVHALMLGGMVSLSHTAFFRFVPPIFSHLSNAILARWQPMAHSLAMRRKSCSRCSRWDVSRRQMRAACTSWCARPLCACPPQHWLKESRCGCSCVPSSTPGRRRALPQRSSLPPFTHPT